MHFFLNYGGPGGYWISDNNQTRTGALRQACEKCYVGPIRASSYDVNGINITIHTYGIHRALYMEIPLDAPEDTRKMYQKAKDIACKFCDRDYKMFSNNCVTSVATVLHSMDKKMTSQDIWLPWSLDQHIKSYCGSYDRTTLAGLFIEKYHEKIQQERFSFLRNRHWARDSIRSAMDIISHAYGNSGGKGERTRANAS